MEPFEYIKHIFLYNPDEPLMFTRFYFWVFFAIVLGVYSLMYRNKNRSIRAGYLFLVSLFFYYKSSGLFFFILLFSTLTDFYIGKWVYESRKLLIKRLLISISVCINLSLLVYFKYAYFITESLNNIFNTNFKLVNYMAAWANESLASGSPTNSEICKAAAASTVAMGSAFPTSSAAQTAILRAIKRISSPPASILANQ